MVKHAALRRPMGGCQSHWSICTRTKEGGRKWEGDGVNLLVTPATKSKPRGQEGIAKMSGCNKPWSVCAVDHRGPVSRDAGEQSAWATPRRRGALLPSRARAKSGKGEHGQVCERCSRRLPVEMDSEQGKMADDGTRGS
jgi:hypothetical protein